ncbi:Protein of unknown function [Bacillus mycoides]|nr:Protein of unknown function [Bacillus mycoides]
MNIYLSKKTWIPYDKENKRKHDVQKLFYPFPTEHVLLNLCEGVIAPVGRWEINVGWRKSKRLRPYTCTDCSLKTEDMRLPAEKSLQSSNFQRSIVPRLPKLRKPS